MPKPPRCGMCGTEHWSSQPCKGVTPNVTVTQDVTPAERLAQGDVTERVTQLGEAVCALIDHVKQLEARFDEMRPKTPAERKRAQREREKVANQCPSQ